MKKGVYQTTPYAPSPTTSWISYWSETLNDIFLEPLVGGTFWWAMLALCFSTSYGDERTELGAKRRELDEDVGWKGLECPVRGLNLLACLIISNCPVEYEV